MSHECCEGVRGLKFSRRYFLKQGGVAMVGPERDARVLAAGGGGDADAGQEAACRAVSARGGGRIEYRRAFWRAELLPVAAEYCDSAAKARWKRCGD